MILLNQSANNDRVVVTLSELTTIPNANYLFVFEREMPGERVAVVVTPSDDESDAKQRYNQYTFDTASLFAGKTAGRYVYKIYEQAGTSEDETGLNMIEQGICEVLSTGGTSYVQYTPETNYNAYNPA